MNKGRDIRTVMGSTVDGQLSFKYNIFYPAFIASSHQTQVIVKYERNSKS